MGEPCPWLFLMKGKKEGRNERWEGGREEKRESASERVIFNLKIHLVCAFRALTVKVI